MSVPRLLLRGMLVGLIAGLLAFGFARTFGEPSVDRAIAFEDAAHKAELAAHPGMADDDPAIFSRATQAGVGLLTGVAVYGAALGGLFALVFALCYGRISRVGPRACAALLALAGFVAVYVVPDLKYPSNPPAIGAPATIGLRTGLYFAMIALSIAAAMASVSLSRILTRRLGGWNACLVGGALFVVLVWIAYVALPVVDEVPDAFPAAVLWKFRVASLGLQAVLWSGIGLMFGAFTERGLRTG